MNINIFKKIKIAQKLFIISIGLAVAILFLSLIAINSLSDQAENSTILRDVKFEKIALAGGTSVSASQIHFDVYQLFTLYALSASEAGRAQELVDDARSYIKKMEDYTNDLDALELSEKEQELIDKIIAEEKRYVKSVNDVLDMIGIDVTMAYMYQNEMNMAYDDLKSALDQLNTYVTDDVTQALDHSVASAVSAKKDFVLIAILALIGGMLVTYIIGRTITVPIRNMTDSMKILAEGNTETEIPAQDHADEIGDMSKAVVVFRDNAIKAKKLEEEQKAAEIKAAEDKRLTMARLADDFEASVMNIVENVSSASTELNSTAGSMSSISENASERAAAVAAAAEEAATNVQTVAAAAEELSHSISEIARQVTEESQIAQDAVKEANETSEFISSLAEATDKISEVVQLINDIADQTNLLALNATIEAARAGDAGKGFAVVANEVKNLASQTGKATEAIADQIQDVQGKTQSAVSAIERISATIRKIDEISTTIAAAVEQQGKATEEISQNVEQTAQGTKEVSSNIAGVTQAANEAGTAASEVASASSTLSESSSQLKTRVVEFIERIRKS